MTALSDLQAAYAAVAVERAAVAAAQDAYAAVAGPLSDAARALLAKGGIELLIHSGDASGCGDCVTNAVSELRARGAVNAAQARLTDAKARHRVSEAEAAAQDALRENPEDEELRAALGGLAEGIE